MNLNHRSAYVQVHLFLLIVLPRKVITLPRKESSEWIKLVPPPYSTALCTKCLITASGKCRYVIINNDLAAFTRLPLIAEAALLLLQA